jgi:hypothetical protein
VLEPALVNYPPRASRSSSTWPLMGFGPPNLQIHFRLFFMFIRLLDKTQWYHFLFTWSMSQNREFLLGKGDILFQVLQVGLKAIILDA